MSNDGEANRAGRSHEYSIRVYRGGARHQRGEMFDGHERERRDNVTNVTKAIHEGKYGSCFRSGLGCGGCVTLLTLFHPVGLIIWWMCLYYNAWTRQIGWCGQSSSPPPKKVFSKEAQRKRSRMQASIRDVMERCPKKLEASKGSSMELADWKYDTV
jgi:hypothetical protein